MTRISGASASDGTRRAGAGVRSLLLVLGAVAACGSARAEEMLASRTTFFSGATSQTIGFEVSGPGVVDVQVVDLGWPDPLQSLSFFASTDTSLLTSDKTGPNTYQFSVMGPGDFYAHIAGVAGASRIAGLPNYGLFGAEVNFTPALVPAPLPAGFSLLATGLVGLVLCGWLRRRSLPSGGEPVSLA